MVSLEGGKRKYVTEHVKTMSWGKLSAINPTETSHRHTLLQCHYILTRD